MKAEQHTCGENAKKYFSQRRCVPSVVGSLAEGRPTFSLCPGSHQNTRQIFSMECHFLLLLLQLLPPWLQLIPAPGYCVPFMRTKNLKKQGKKPPKEEMRIVGDDYPSF